MRIWRGLRLPVGDALGLEPLAMDDVEERVDSTEKGCDRFRSLTARWHDLEERGEGFGRGAGLEGRGFGELGQGLACGAGFCKLELFPEGSGGRKGSTGRERRDLVHQCSQIHAWRNVAANVSPKDQPADDFGVASRIGGPAVDDGGGGFGSRGGRSGRSVKTGAWTCCWSRTAALRGACANGEHEAFEAVD